MDILFVSALLCLGAAGGFMAGLLGIGGGVIFVPCLILLLSARGIPLEQVSHIAIATTMATILLTALASVRTHQKRNTVHWSIVLAISPGIFLGALVGGQIFSGLHTGALTLLFAGFVIFSAWQMRSQGKTVASGRSLPGKIGLIGAGSVIGFISSLVGVGGGFISVPFLTWCNIPIRNAIATSTAISIPIAFFVTSSNIFNSYKLSNLPTGSLGYVYLPALACLAMASVMTAPLGAKLTYQLNVAQIRKIFSNLLLILALYMTVRGMLIFI